MTGDFSAQWLALREPADAAARSAELVGLLRAQPAGADGLVIRDLGCGTGSLGRWLAPQLPGPQRWILEDRDPALLAHAADSMPNAAADGTPVQVRTHTGDVTALTGDDLAGVALVTCSALLDLLTAAEVAAIAAALAGHRTTALFTLSVTGEVTLEPADDLDDTVAAAFNAHQQRTNAGRRLLGPQAPEVAAAALRRHGAQVSVRASPWRLGPAQAALTQAWFAGWVDAAAEQRPELDLVAYRRRRSADIDARRVTVTVGHCDLLARFD